MTRWNRKGSTHAKARMTELRQRALEYARNDLAREYEARFGRHWFGDAKNTITPTSEPMDRGARIQEHIDWLRRSLCPAS